MTLLKRKELVNAAKELNKELGLDPEIEVKSVEKEYLEEKLTEAAMLADKNYDNLSDETWAVLKYMEDIGKPETKEGTREIKCPKCKSINTIPIGYGYPGPQMQKEAKKGNLKLGGCVIREDNPDGFCKDCKHEWKEG